MMELRCPECASPEVEHDPKEGEEARRCANCGARFSRDSAFVTVLDAEANRGEATPQQLFAFNPQAAAIELRKGDGAITAINPHSDADELNVLIDGAQAAKAIEGKRPRARLDVYPLSIGDPSPLLAVDPGTGPTLLGFELKLRQGKGEDPVAFTVRFLEEAVQEANGLAAGLAADSERLDRIATYMNEQRSGNGGDVCEFVARELHDSGRLLTEEE